MTEERFIENIYLREIIKILNETIGTITWNCDNAVKKLRGY